MTKLTKLHKQWIAEPEYQKAYEQVASEFEAANAVIAARIRWLAQLVSAFEQRL